MGGFNGQETYIAYRHVARTLGALRCMPLASMRIRTIPRARKGLP